MIPTTDDLRSAPMRHKFGDLFNPPALTNFLGVVQTEMDLTGISSLNFPPYAMAGQKTAGLFVDGRYFQATGRPITFIWYPDRVEREAEYQGLYLKSVTCLAVQKRAVLIELQVENRLGSKRSVNIRFGLQGSITKSLEPWNNPPPPSEPDNEAKIDRQRKAVLFSARHSSAHILQGTNPLPDKITSRDLEFFFELKPGGKKTIHFITTQGESVSEIKEIYDSLIGDVADEINRARLDWNEELKSIFTPGNPRYSGSLPILTTIDKEILRLYWISILGVVYFKRDNPFSVYGRAYDTLMPVYWQTVTFIWDYALSSFTHALLDPAVMRKYLERWMLLDIYNHFGTDYLTGSPIGYWYSANDLNMMTIINDYLRWTGNYEWLRKEINQENNSKRVIDYVEQYASSWKRLKSRNGLADYGGINNLLECVSTYIHEVASLNAANVFNLRKAADIFNFIGDKVKSRKLYDDAQSLVNEVQKLYADGQGFWNTRFPDGSLVDVRHCYDFFTIINTIADDLSVKQKKEMVEFFKKEFMTPLWMRALAPVDNDAMFSVRPDHQWNGAYPAWPAQSLKALYRIKRSDLAYNWLKGLAKSFNQGPLGQAHFVDDVFEPEEGGARKAPMEVPYMTDWACTGGGSWVSVIIESIFGVHALIGGSIAHNPRFSDFDPQAELHNLVYQGKKYTVTKKGLFETGKL